MDNVVRLHPDKCPCCIAKEWQLDLEEYAQSYANAEPFSDEKNQFSRMICMIIENEKVPFDIRVRACQIIYKYSDHRKSIDTVYGNTRPRDNASNSLKAIDKW